MAHMQQPFSSALPASAARGSQQQAASQVGLTPEMTPAASIDAPAVPAVLAVQACIEAPPERPPRAAIITQRVPPKRPAPPPPAPAPMAKKARTSPYTEFYQEQRLLLPPGLRNAEREKLLGQMWKALTEEQRAKYYRGVAATPTPFHIFRQEQRLLLPPGLRNADRERLLGHMWKSLSEAERARYQRAPEAAPAATPASAPAPNLAPARYHAPAQYVAHTPAHAQGVYFSGAHISPAAAAQPPPVQARLLAPAVVVASCPAPGRPPPPQAHAPLHAPSLSRAARDVTRDAAAAAWSNPQPKVDSRWYDTWRAAALEDRWNDSWNDRWNDRWKTKVVSAASNAAPPPPALPPRRDLHPHLHPRPQRSTESQDSAEDPLGSGSAGQAALALTMLSEHRPTRTSPAAHAPFSQAASPPRCAQGPRSPGRPVCAPPVRRGPWPPTAADPMDPEEERIAVWNQATGKKLTGQAAPKCRNLDKYLRQHPDYSILYEGGASSAAAAAANAAAANNGYSLSAAHKDCGSSPHRGSSTEEGNGAHYSSPHKGPHSSRLGGGQGAEVSVHSDCGDCKNCLDKPKNGGRGIRKQACLRRSCYNAQEASDDESPSSP